MARYTPYYTPTHMQVHMGDYSENPQDMMVPEYDIKNYLRYLRNTDVDADDAKEAAATLFAFMASQKCTHLTFDLLELNKEKTPTRKMTIQQIEDILGYNVEIVGGTDNAASE